MVLPGKGENASEGVLGGFSCIRGSLLVGDKNPAPPGTGSELYQKLEYKYYTVEFHVGGPRFAEPSLITSLRFAPLRAREVVEIGAQSPPCGDHKKPVENICFLKPVVDGHAV